MLIKDMERVMSEIDEQLTEFYRQFETDHEQLRGELLERLRTLEDLRPLPDRDMNAANCSPTTSRRRF